MKSINSILLIIPLLILGCVGRGGEQLSDDVITVDVTKSYPQKKEMILQDFMDVEYIALETNDEFVNQGRVLDIGKKIILVKNTINDGDIFIYDRHGKALRKINHNGPKSDEEYTNILNITLDEDNEEMFVSDIYNKKIYVYDLYGKFKRSFRHKEGGGSLFYTEIFNYDRDNLLCCDPYNEEIAFVLVSKQDGSITKEIKIPFKEKKDLSQTRMQGEQGVVMSPGPYRPITPYNGNWILLEFSSDTVYTLLPDYSLQPFIVRTPPIQSMDPEVMLRLRLLSDRYYFMDAVVNEYNFNTRRGFSTTFLMYDKQEKVFFGYTLYNGDYSIKKEIYMSSLRPVNHEIESWQKIEAYQLVESYKNGELKDGKLKEIASKLDEEDNPVIMLIKHKK